MSIRPLYTMILLLAVLLPFFAKAQTAPAPLREFRGVWIATVKNIDYPSRPGLPADSLRQEWLNLLQSLKQRGFNAVVLQVRPSADALYPTELAPWSSYLTGRQGVAPAPLFDPLQFWIETAHSLGFEFHAWLNPYRATFDFDTSGLAPNHVFHQHRDWLVPYGKKFYLNPALPQVRQHFTTVVADLVRRYDVDAIHLDDYFYPYKVPKEVWPDSLDFVRLGADFRNADDWRRNNINLLIRTLADTIKAIKPYVQFGVSPFGVWRNRERDISGSDTRASLTCYDDLYADVRLWMQEGWLDYVAPQLYWNIGYQPADYEKLLYWWKDFATTTTLYVGHSLYKVSSNPAAAWQDPNEIPRQIQLNRTIPACVGSMVFSANHVIRNPIGVSDSLASGVYAYRSLLPEVTSIRLPGPASPKLRCLRRRAGNVLLNWKIKKKDYAQMPAYYAVYRFEGRRVGDAENPANLLAVTSRNQEQVFIDTTAEATRQYTYTVVGLNRNHHISQLSRPKAILKKANGFRRRCVQK
jgi:uncharacterized lipoprotein YddW (UPF0748 family)